MRIIDAGAKMMYGSSPSPWREGNDRTGRDPGLSGADIVLAVDGCALVSAGSRVETAAEETASKTTKASAERQAKAI
jgi:hypothetical protein